MPPQLKLGKIKATLAKPVDVDEPDFVVRAKNVSAPVLVMTSLHPSALATTFEPVSEDEEPDLPSASTKKKKSNKGILIAGAAAIGFMALKGK